MAKRNPGLKKAHVVHEYTAEQIAEVKRCMEDPIYFAKNYVMIKHPTKGQIKFNLYGYQEEIIKMYQDNRYNILLSARQTGKTETTCAYILWFAIFHPDKTILVVSNKSQGAKEIIGKIQYAYEELPDWLKPGINETSWNKHECRFDNNSRIIAESTAPDSARGKAISLLYCDEFAFVRAHIQEEFWDSVLPTLSTGGACIISSTPNGDSNLFAALYRGAEMGTNDFIHRHIAWDLPPGRDEKFKEQQIGLLGERKWKQEYECDFLTSDGNLIDSLTLASMEKEIKLHTKVAFNLKGEQDFWVAPQRNMTFIVTVDPAGGLGEDYSTINVFTFPKMEQVMEWRNNTFQTPSLYRKLKDILNYLASWGGTVYFTIENNGIGNGMISLFEVDENPPRANLISEDGKKSLGMTTTPTNKLKTCIRLKEMIERRHIKLHSLTLVKELKSYVRKERSYAAQRGATDDLVSTLLLLIRLIEQMTTFDMNAYSLMYQFENNGEWADQEYKADDDFIMMTPIM